MVDKSIDHEKLLPICFLQKHCPFFTSISVRVSRKEREKQIAPPSRHFSSTKTLHQSAHEESLSYCKRGFEGISLYIHCITIFFILMREARAVRTDSYSVRTLYKRYWTATVRKRQGEGTGGGGRTAYHTWQLFETEVLTSIGLYITF